jgi:hypothetical protein
VNDALRDMRIRRLHVRRHALLDKQRALEIELKHVLDAIDVLELEEMREMLTRKPKETP